jgi:hypothetical protein
LWALSAASALPFRLPHIYPARTAVWLAAHSGQVGDLVENHLLRIWFAANIEGSNVENVALHFLRPMQAGMVPSWRWLNQQLKATIPSELKMNKMGIYLTHPTLFLAGH